MSRISQPDFLIIGAPRPARPRCTRRSPATRTSSSATPRSRSTGCATAPRRRPGAAPATALAAGVDLAAPTSTPRSSTARGSTRRAARARRSTCGAAAPTGGSPRPCPTVRLIAVVRDPIDRAYSNWMHLWSDGLEPEPDFETAFALPGRAGGGRLGAVLALPRAGAVRRAARAPLRLRRPPTGSWCCATATSSTTRAPRSTAPAASSGSARVWSTPSRGTTRAASSGRAGGHRCSARRSGPAPGSASSPRRSVWRRASAPLTAGSDRFRRRPTDRDSRPTQRRAAAACVHRRHRPALRAHRRGLLGDWTSGEPRVLRRARRRGGDDEGQRTMVTRSWAPSGRAASM